MGNTCRPAFANLGLRRVRRSACCILKPLQQDLHDFLQTLFAPWGFGKDYQASDREVRAHIRRLKLHIFNDNKVHFKARLVLM